ncbi:hypothetical protein [Rhodococcus gannanensis]|uniref:Uncharacterized protein n=1 Tax=Rhodococcus gannanensis TaxID=1960308 RepID=A0ABW4P1A2_9NOCA
MGGELKFEDATVRSVAAALVDSAGELALLADRVEVAVECGGEPLAEGIRRWARRTATDAALLFGTADRYREQDAAAAASIGRLAL